MTNNSIAQATEQKQGAALFSAGRSIYATETPAQANGWHQEAERIRHQAGNALNPYTLGLVDFLEGYGCCPEMYYVQRWQMDEYRQGWLDAKAERTLPAWVVDENEQTDYDHR